jgi:hypothetical protein
MPKTGKHGRSQRSAARPKCLQTAFKLNEKNFNWSFRRAFWKHDGWKPCNDPCFFVEHIIEKLRQLEKQIWQEVLDASGGKAVGHGNNNHFIAANQLPRIERKAFIKEGYMDLYDKVFSLRLSGTERLIGVVNMNCFEILWFDPSHTFF